jgi:Na+/proline symporter
MNPTLYAGIVVVYVLVMLAVGYGCMKRTRSVGDFFLGGRTLGPWMSAFAYGTTYFSAVLFIGYAGKLGWGFGIYTMWIVVGNTLVGTLLAWKLLAGRTREMTARLNAITMPEFLRARYDCLGLQIIAALVVFVFLVPYSASVLMGLSYLFEMTLQIRYEQALYFLTGLTAVYLVMGGYFAVAISDFIRGIIEFAGVLLMVYLLAHRPETGGFAQATAALLPDPAPAAAGRSLGELAPGLAAVKQLGAGTWLHVSAPGWLTLLALVLITSFGPWALPQMVQKFYSIRSQKDVTRALIIASVFALFMSFGAYYSGALTHLFYHNKLPAELLADKPMTGNDLKNLSGLAGRLRDDPSALCRFLRSQASPETLALLSSYQASNAPAKPLADALAKDFNRVAKSGVLHAAQPLAGLELSDETQNLIRQIRESSEKPGSEKLTHIGRLVLNDAFAPMLGPIQKEPNWDKIMPHFITTSQLPIALVLVIVLMVFSASMSSLSSLVLVSSSALAIDIYGALVNRQANPRRTMALLRLLCALFVGCSLYIALKRPSFIVNLMIMSWGTLAGVFLAPYLYGLFWRRTTLPGVLAGVAAGLASAFTLFPKWGPDGVPLAGAITMFLPLVVVPVVSLLTTPPDPALVEKAFGTARD